MIVKFDFKRNRTEEKIGWGRLIEKEWVDETAS